MTIVLTIEYLDDHRGGWVDYAPLRIAQLGTKSCTNKTLCEEKINILLPVKPPFHPQQFLAYKSLYIGSARFDQFFPY
ncbi:Sialyltransferase-like protein 1, partial [Mucuna pruriens]